jgi:4-amino-4-deoxy-L-arabinose transferase-like glycosyltransferase
LAKPKASSPWFGTWLLAIIPFLGFWTYGLFDLDEGFYGAIVGEMNRRSEWLVPYYNGHPWYEKPILLYWVAKPCLMLFGVWLGPRLPSVLASLGLMFWVSRFSKKSFNESSAQIAVLILAGSLLFVGVGRMMLVDPLLNLGVSGALLLFWESLKGNAVRNRALSGVTLGLGVLAKGPLAILLFLAVVGVSFWRLPPLRTSFRGGWLGFSALLVLTTGLWYVPAYLVSGQLFVQKFLIEQNLQRFSGGDAAHSAGPAALPLYFVVLLIGMFPWSIAAFRASRSIPEQDDGLRSYLSIWVWTILIFFTISSAKLVHYILPASVPIALLASDWYSRRANWGEARPVLGLGKFSLAPLLVGVICFVSFFTYYRLTSREAHQMALAVKEQGATLAAYQLPRREQGLGTLQPKIAESSLPSLEMYRDDVVLEAETFDQLLAAPKPLYIITRPFRLGEEDYQKAASHHLVLEQMRRETNYELYRLRAPKERTNR